MTLRLPVSFLEESKFITEKGSRIAVVGIIASGKTTFCNNILKDNDNVILAAEAIYDNPYFELFYEDPQRYAYKMQMHMLHARKEASKQALRNSDRSVQTIMDTCLRFDYTYAHLNKTLGNISEDDWQRYLKEYNSIDDIEIPYPDKIFYLKCDPSTCFGRIQQRILEDSKRECENAIELQYLQQQALSIEDWLDKIKHKTTVIKLDWNNFEISAVVQTRRTGICGEQAKDFYSKILKNQKSMLVSS